MSQPTSHHRIRGRAARASPRTLAALASAMVIAIAAAHATAATEITAQAAADDGAFLAYAPPPAQPAGLCLVDTGVNLNPATAPEVAYRTAIDGGSGDDASTDGHGTTMAMMAAAPADGWGMTGTAPAAIRIVSVRILEPGQTGFPFAYYTAAIDVCLELQPLYNIKVINLSLGTSATPSSQEYAAIANAVAQANNYGVDVVAAAGNDTGGPLDYPAAIPAVLSVGATDTQSSAFCQFSNHGTGLRLLAPGCDLDAADPATGTPAYDYYQGTSEASSIAAATLTALRAYQPTLTPQAAETLLTNADSGTLDIAKTFDDAGLGTVVTAGTAAEPQPPTPPAASGSAANTSPSDQSQTGATTPTPPPRARPGPSLEPLPRPAIAIEVHGRQLVLRFRNRPSGTVAQVRVLGRRRGRPSQIEARETGRTRLDIAAVGVLAVQGRYRDPYDLQRTGPWTTEPIPQPTRPAPAAPTR
jgi:hypothetical protein